MSGSGGVLEMVKRANKTRNPEDSIALRAATLATVLMGVLALAVERAISPSTAAFVFVSLCVAYWLSYVRRSKDNWHLKILISILAIFALFRFFGQLRAISTLDEVRFPLADLFLWVQVLHGFDLPARKDLNFSLGSSLTLMAVAGSISQDFWYAPVLAMYFVFAIAALIFSHRSEMRDGAAEMLARAADATRVRSMPRRDIAKGIAVSLVAGTVLFLVIPQPSGVRTFALPFALGSGGGLASGGGIANPGFEGGGAAGTRAIGSAFYGFDDTLNLRVRGELNDDVVIRIRASGPAMWRGLLFAEYDGVQWKGDQTDPTPLSGEPPLYYPTELRSLGPRSTISGTFYIEREQPSVVFTGGQPETIWTEERVSVDKLGGLRLDSTLTEGAVYSAVSSVGAAIPEELRALPQPGDVTLPDDPKTPEHEFDKYLQLPSDLPERVGALARRITADAPTQYDKVKAIESWLAENYRYSIESPVPPLGQDAVDHFLFETDVGFCEQFASATIVMLRSLGIPARMVAGYAVGNRNPFTGYYELKNSDAHTWVDVWFPKWGWYEFDPTFAIPPAEEDISNSVPLVRLFESATERFGKGLSKDVNRYIRTGLLVMLVAVVLIGGWMLWTRVLRRKRVLPVPDVVAGGPITHAFRRFEDALAARGSPRAPPETAAELIARTGHRRPRTGSALDAFQKERYGAEPPRHQEVEEAVAELDALSAETVNGDPSQRAPADR